ncbi:MAG: hypothetical protein CMJ78_17255 [Planctomycetaceae bacterium]|nr:hypothetical protein [Planctomycetaceae bacterium]
MSPNRRAGACGWALNEVSKTMNTYRTITRRDALTACSMSLSGLAMHGLLHAEAVEGRRDSYNMKPRETHFAPRARAVIQLFQNGGPSQMDLFDPKPELTKQAGKPHPGEVETFQLGNKNIIFPTQFKIKPHGESGMNFGSPLPHMASIADEWCMIRSMHTVNNNHPFAISMFQSGKPFFGYPAMGSWITYALGSENRDLPGYIVLRDPAGYNTSGKAVWSSGWMPAVYQGTEFNSQGNAVHHLHPTKKRPAEIQARSLKLLAELNRRHQELHPREFELEARIENFELAARMQLAAKNVLDLSKETKETRKRYGLDDATTAGYGARCLMARRLVESGVRYIQVFPPLKPSFQPWDSHGSLKSGIETISKHVDQSTAALITDLKQRGLLDEVIVMWTGEFGRIPITEGADGRDHNRNAFTTLMAGGGFKRGYTHGATDDFAYKAVEDRVSVPDLHATILHQMGIDHTELSFLHKGRHERLTDPEVTSATVVDQLLA